MKRPDSILHYFSKTGEQPPSPKRIRTATADESEESESKTDTRASGGSAGAMDACSSSSGSSESKQSKSFNHEWLVGRKHWLDPQQSGMFCCLCKKNMINDRLIVVFGTPSLAREFNYKALLLMNSVLPTEIQ